MPYNPFERPTTPSPVPMASTPARNEDSPVALLKKAIDCKHKGVIFHATASRKTHTMGLQGHKRWNRYQMHEDLCELVMLQHYLIDMYGEDYDSVIDYEAPAMPDVKTYLEEYNHYETTYSRIMSDISNQLVLMNCAHDAHIIRCMLGDAAKEIEKTRRWAQDFEKAGWDWAYIRFKDDQLHEKMKCKETYKVEP